MKIFRFLLLSCRLRCLAVALCVSGSSVLCLGAATPDRFDRTKARIAALLNHRLKPDDLPAKPANPFLFTGGSGGTLTLTPERGGPPVSVTPEPIVNTVMDDDQILAFCVSRLRIGGQVQRGGRAHLLINSTTYKEDDLIPVRGGTDIVYYVKVVRIAPSGVVFGYNDAVLTLPLKT